MALKIANNFFLGFADYSTNEISNDLKLSMTVDKMKRFYMKR